MKLVTKDFLNTYRCVNQVEHVLFPLEIVEHGSCLCLHCDASLSLHREMVQYLLVGCALVYYTYVCVYPHKLLAYSETSNERPQPY